jgi:hypothetical protein
MIMVGTTKDEVQRQQVIAATFHPFLDHWYIVCPAADALGNPRGGLAVFIDGVCTRLEVLPSIEVAMQRFVQEDMDRRASWATR